MRKSLYLIVLLVSVLLSGCATMQSSKAPGTDLSMLKTFYVQRLPADTRGIEKLIAERLKMMGNTATSSDPAVPPSPVDAIITYQDKWMWDMTMYMIKLDIQIRDGKTGLVLASGESIRPSLQRKSPEGMVEEVFTNTFKK